MIAIMLKGALSLIGVFGAIASITSIPEKYKTWKAVSFVVSTLLIIVCVILLIMSIPDTHETLRTVFLFVFILLATVVLCSIACFYVTKIVVMSYNKNAYIQEEYRVAGITKIGKFTPTEEMQKQFIDAKEVKICACSVITLLLQATELFESALSNNVRFKILLTRPVSQEVKNIEKVEGPERIGTIDHEIHNAIGQINRYNRISTNGGIEWRYFPDALLRLAIIICDDKYGTLTLNLPPKRSQDAIKIKMIQTERGLLEDCVKYFDSCWKLAGENKEQ